MTVLFFFRVLWLNSVRGKFLILFFLFLLIMIPFITFILQKKSSKLPVENFAPTVIPSPIEESHATTTKLVPESKNPQDKQQLPFTPFDLELSWTIDDKQELWTDIKNQVIYYSSKNTFGHFGMPGKEWIAIKKNISKEEVYTISNDFRNAYDRELSKLGWLQYTKLGGFKLSPIEAGGPVGNVWGYIKVENGTIKAIIFSSRLPVSISGMGSTGKCPCDVTFRIFVSNAQDLTKVLPKSP